MLSITRPTLLLDERKCKNNIQRMAQKADRLGVKLVPHFKTHQSLEIGEWFRAEGIDAITVSSVKMASFFGENGWNDITIAFPLNVLEVDAINSLLSRGVRLKVLVVSVEAVEFLNEHLVAPIEAFIEIDAGYGRSGVPAHKLESIQSIWTALRDSEKVRPYGLYCHPGDTYHENSTEAIQSLWAEAIEKMKELKKELDDQGTPLKVRMGDTPGCSVVEQVNGVDEIGPGNFVFYDLVMDHLGVCEAENIAVVMACPIVAKNAESRQIVIHGGAVHFSKDYLLDEDGNKFFGEVVILEEDGWSPVIEGIRLKSVSQEHGILRASEELFETLQVGDVIGILPIHSCLTANLMKSYTTLKGERIPHLEKVF